MKSPSLEYDLRTTDWIAEKICKSNEYAQNLYAALCNNEFQKKELIPALKDERWSCSWRYAGGIISNIQNQGDYMDWYCSGIMSDSELAKTGFVSESIVTDVISDDLNRLGWIVISD